jgi:hypothetical protein
MFVKENFLDKYAFAINELMQQALQ